MKFRGQRNPHPDLQAHIFVAKDGVEKPLSPEPSQRVMNHSDKFEWGYDGELGSTQLALALLLEVTQNPVTTILSDRSLAAYLNTRGS